MFDQHSQEQEFSADLLLIGELAEGLRMNVGLGIRKPFSRLAISRSPGYSRNVMASSHLRQLIADGARRMRFSARREMLVAT